MENKIIEALAAAQVPMKAGELAQVTGVDKVEVDKIIKKLVKEGRVDSPKRCFYGLKN